MKRIVWGSILLVACVSLSGCVVALGNRDTSAPKGREVTLGQQLVDLKKAHETGAITDAEYQVQKERLLSHQSR